MGFNRLYSLSISNFYKYSFFYFFVFQIKSYMIKDLNNKGIKISFLYNKALNKTNRLYVLYAYRKTETFSLPKIVNSLHPNNNNNNNEFSMVHVNSLLYKQYHYNNSYYLHKDLRNMYENWYSFFGVKKYLIFNDLALNYYRSLIYVVFLSRMNIIKQLFSYISRVKISDLL